MALEVKYLPEDAELPKEIFSGDRRFCHKMLTGRNFYAEDPNGAWLDTPLAFFEFEPTGREPLRIIIGDRTYKLHRERLYIPERATPAETEYLFDYLARCGYEERFVRKDFNSQVYHHLFDLALQAAEAEEIPLVLDYGCGTGIAALAASTYHRQLRIVGVDISEEMVRISRSSGLEVAKIGYDQDLPFKSYCFDAVVMAFVADFLTDSQPFQRIHRVLRRQARIAFNLYHPSEGFQEDFLQVLQKTGYVNVEFSHTQVSSSGITREIWFVVAEKPG